MYGREDPWTVWVWWWWWGGGTLDTYMLQGASFARQTGGICPALVAKPTCGVETPVQQLMVFFDLGMDTCQTSCTPVQRNHSPLRCAGAVQQQLLALCPSLKPPVRQQRSQASGAACLLTVWQHTISLVTHPVLC
jgi:hypothetical protein